MSKDDSIPPLPPPLLLPSAVPDLRMVSSPPLPKPKVRRPPVTFAAPEPKSFFSAHRPKQDVDKVLAEDNVQCVCVYVCV